MNPAVEKNLERMVGYEEGEMRKAMQGESMGGNAGHWNSMSCIGVNFYHDSKGEIQYFGNFQDVPNDIVKNNFHGCFHIAYDMQKNTKISERG